MFPDTEHINAYEKNVSKQGEKGESATACY